MGHCGSANHPNKSVCDWHSAVYTMHMSLSLLHYPTRDLQRRLFTAGVAAAAAAAATAAVSKCLTF